MIKNLSINLDGLKVIKFNNENNTMTLYYENSPNSIILNNIDEDTFNHYSNIFNNSENMVEGSYSIVWPDGTKTYSHVDDTKNKKVLID